MLFFVFVLVSFLSHKAFPIKGRPVRNNVPPVPALPSINVVAHFGARGARVARHGDDRREEDGQYSEGHEALDECTDEHQRREGPVEPVHHRPAMDFKIVGPGRGGGYASHIGSRVCQGTMPEWVQQGTWRRQDTYAAPHAEDSLDEPQVAVWRGRDQPRQRHKNPCATRTPGPALNSLGEGTMRCGKACERRMLPVENTARTHQH